MGKDAKTIAEGKPPSPGQTGLGGLSYIRASVCQDIFTFKRQGAVLGDCIRLGVCLWVMLEPGNRSPVGAANHWAAASAGPVIWFSSQAPEKAVLASERPTQTYR